MPRTRALTREKRQGDRGRASVHRTGLGSGLPFPDGTFDMVTRVETCYYWPDLPANVREILRVLKPGGTFALIAKRNRGGGPPNRDSDSLSDPRHEPFRVSQHYHRVERITNCFELIADPKSGPFGTEFRFQLC
jgi:SAM-dependent methyltransferase